MVFLAQESLTIPPKDITSWYFDNPEYNLDEPVYIEALDESKYYTGRQARSTIRKLAAGLRKWGLKEGDCACVHGFNNLHYPILVNGIIAAGGIFSGTNPAYQPYELAHAVRSADISFFIVEPDVLPNAREAAKQCGIPESHILIFDTYEDSKVPEGFKSWKWLLEHGEEDWRRLNDLESAKKTPAARMFSSGTTGLPKAATLTHSNFIAQHVQTIEHNPKPYKVKRMCVTPFFHMAAAPVVHFSPLKNGFTTFIQRRFELEKFLWAMEKWEITELIVVPPMAIAIIMSDLTKKYSLKSVKTALCGAAPLDKGPQARLKALLNEEAGFTQVWGMTETSCIASMFRYPEHDTTGSVGRPVAGLDFKLADDDNNDISKDDTRGELCVRGPTVINGYYKNDEANKSSFDADGFFHTGDIAYRDGKTKLWYIVDRKKELIKVRGFQVAPPELEAVLLSHPAIVDAAVIGVKSPDKSLAMSTEKSSNTDEFPRGYVVRRNNEEGKALNVESIRKYMAERLAKFKQLDGGITFVDEIPKNPSGKILKRILREQAENETGGKQREVKL